jgi:hypothetical protein
MFSVGTAQAFVTHEDLSAGSPVSAFTSFSAPLGAASSGTAGPRVKPAAAALPASFGSEGEGAGQLNEPPGVAVETGRTL